jgi:hypothetical protein
MEKRLYQIYAEDGTVTGSNYFTPGEQPENSTDLLPKESFVVMKFNRVQNIFYEGATAEELAAAKKASVPETVSRRQLRLALVLSQFDLSLIDNIINQLPEPNRSFALIAWNDAIVFERKDDLLNQLAGMLGLNEEALDDLFINAGKL